MANRVLFDTSILIDEVRIGCHTETIARLPSIVCASSVVLAEMWRCARRDAEKDFLRKLSKNQVVPTPTGNAWIESGIILAKMQKQLGFTPAKLRDLHFDV